MKAVTVKFLNIFKRKKLPMIERRSGAGKVVFGIFFVIFALYAFTLLYPLFWMVLNSFRDTADYNIAIAVRRTFSLKIVWEFSNYFNVVKLISTEDASYLGMFWNSLWMTAVSGALGVFVPTVVAYCLSKYKFKGRNFLYGTAIFSMIMPIIGNMGAAYQFWGETGLFDTPMFIIISGLGGLGGMHFLIMYGFFKNVPWDYAEAIFIDGGNDFTVFFRIMLPQAFSMLLLFFVMNFMGGWNAYMNYLLMMPGYPTLATGMYLVSSTLERTGQMPVYYAALIVSMIPLLVLFLIFSDQIFSKVSISGLKG